MDIKALAKAFTGLCAEGKFDEAGERFWSNDIVSREPVPGGVTEGRAAVKRKGEQWAAQHEIHGAKVQGPFVGGDQFVVRFTMDITPKGQSRLTMDEVGVYTVKDGKIVDESFFYAT